MTVSEQFEVYWKQITTRKRNPAKPATLAAYRTYWTKWIKPRIGHLQIEKVENGVMKKFVAKLAESDLKPPTIGGISNLVKSIVSSAIDENGNALHPRKWNQDFIDAPPINTRDQKSPIISGPEITEALQVLPGLYVPLIALGGASGCRISEILSIRMGVTEASSYWDYAECKLVIRKALYRGKEQATKTGAGVREVDLYSEINDYLKDYFERIREGGDYLFAASNGKPIRLRTAYDEIHNVIPGFHSLRRYRITHLENCGVPDSLSRFWSGHSSSDVHQNYVKLHRDIALRKEWALKAGLGFDIPKKRLDNPNSVCNDASRKEYNDEEGTDSSGVLVPDPNGITGG